MSIYKMSNYKSTIKSLSTTPRRRRQTTMMESSNNSAASTKFLLINLLVLVQTCLCSTTTTTTTQHPLVSSDESPAIMSLSGFATTLTKLTTTSKRDESVKNTGSAENVASIVSKAGSAASALNDGLTADVESVDAAADDDDYEAVDNDLVINQIITNLTNSTLFHDASSHEYDATTVLLLGNVTHSCLQKCVDEETRFLNDFGVKCSMGDNRTECYRQRCFKGCELWWNALKEFEPCQEACSSTQFYPFDMPCISACEQSQRRYWHLQRLRAERVVTTLQPQLLHDNEALNTVTLKWPISMELLPAQYLASRPFNIQYQYVMPTAAIATTRTSTTSTPAMVNDTPDSHVQDERQHAKQEDYPQQDVDIAKQWWNLADYNCNENFECDIMDGLMPYTAYKFRFELLFGENLEDVLHTPASDVYTTSAMGSPISPPVIKQAIALDHAHIVVFWAAGKFPNGPLKNYKIHLEHEDSNFKMEKIIPSNYSYHIFSDLLAATTYTVHLSMINQEDEGPFVEAMVTTKDFVKTSLKLDDFNSFVMAGEYNIILKSLDPLVDTKTLFRSEEILVDFDVHQYSKQVFLVDSRGHIFSLFIDNPLNYSMVQLTPAMEGFEPSKISVDWLNQRLYIAGVTSTKNWQIISTDLQGSSLQVINDKLPTPLDHMQVDPLNGWIFASDIEGHLLKLNLATKRLDTIQSFLDIGQFSIDYLRYLLKTFDTKEGNMYELSYDGRYSRKLAANISPQFHGDILSFNYLENNLLLASNGTHLLRQHFDNTEVEIIAIRDVEWCWQVIPLMAHHAAKVQQPLPRPLREPRNLQAILSDTKAKITWSAPERVEEFQNRASWQKWEYELEIMDVSSNSAFNIRSVKTTYFEVERLQANNLYKIKVRAMFASISRMGSNTVASEWSQELMTRTWPMGNHRLLWASANGLYETNELSEELELRGLQKENILSFVQVNSSLYYVSQPDRKLKCMNLMNPEISCGFSAAHVNSVDYDWKSGKLYWSDRQRNCIMRSDLNGGNRDLLAIFDARQIKVDSLRGFLYYTTDSRVVRRHLNGALINQEVEYYQVNGNGETIRGFALDYLANHVYWFVQHQEESAKLLRSDLDVQKIEDVLELPKDSTVALDSLQYVAEIDGFMWLTGQKTQAIVVRKENLAELSEIVSPLREECNYVKLRSDFVPFMDYAVVPEAVDKESVHITEGYWDDFNIKWSAISNNHNLTIFYKVLIAPLDLEHRNQVLSFETSQPLVRITEFKMASHIINVTITPVSLWASGPSTAVQLKTPSAAPKQPKNLRVFVEQLQEPLQNEANITALVRWDSPDNVSTEKEVFYKVYCWLKEELHSVKDIEDMGLKSHEVRFYNLKKEESYMFQVQAFSLSRSKGGEKTSLLTHFINPDVQSRPKLIFSTAEYIGELDMDLNMTKVWVHTSSEVEHMVVMPGEQRLIWVNENVELMTYQPGLASLKLARMRAEVLSLCVDWIQRKVYWAELSGDIEHAVDIYELDLNQYEGKVMTGTRLFSLNEGKLLKNMVVLPYSRSLLWLEYDIGVKNATVQGKNLTDLTDIKLKNLPPVVTMFEGSRHPEMESVNVMDFKGKLYAYEIQRHLMTNLKIPLNPLDQVRSFERDAGFIYTLTNRSIKAYNRRKHNLEYFLNLADVRVIKAFNFQEYPPRECLMQEKIEDLQIGFESLANLFIANVAEDYMVLQLPRKNPFENCRLPVPGLKYQVTVQDDNEYVETFKLDNLSVFNVTDLRPFTNYTLDIKAASYYQQKLMLEEMHYPMFTVRTNEGTPSKPLNFTVQALNPSEIAVSWLEPEQLNAEKVTYQLHWQLGNSSLSSRKIVEGFEVTLVNLEPSQEYTMWLDVFSKPSRLNSTDKLTIYTYPEPEPLMLMDRQAYNMTLRWHPNVHYDSAILECLPHTTDPDDTPFSIDITGIDDNITVVNLEPKIKYEFYLKLNFPSVSRSYEWPELQSSHYTFETLGDAPGRPGQPQIEHITGEIFKVFWPPAHPNGAVIIEYSLEALQARNHKRIRRDATNPLTTNGTSSISMLSQLPWVEELQPIEDKWVVYCNTTELSCIVRELHTLHLLMFRVRARNEPYGWGPYSEDSERVLEPYVSPQKRNSLVLAILAPAAIVTTCVIVLFVIHKVHRRRLKAKQLLAKSRPSIWSNVSSMQQQLAARNRAFSMTSNSTMYTGGPLSDADIALLPHINWSQISLLNFLGSGAFGEVYEGLIKHEDQQVPEKVAIKTLRKGSSEFAELLQEAQLMSNFKHENIVRLIGVCCDTESISIIMEHMEGGDLLSYLRESRSNSNKPVASLQLLDLMSMCIDVATGMAYLEDMHFVHRDLACRNCLVSSRIPSKRTVKIGDFGLARDIYKNDYYRKEGEALMPVRWMAPESLVDGVFTTQSDVWAFGVLCWEILTLGQQPYAARNNFEVLTYVKEEGRLEQPDNCPDKLFSLMTECWLTDADERPSFRKIFNTLLAIKTDVRRVSLGYNIDDSDYAMYANQHGIVFSSFLASPLNKVKEEDEENDDGDRVALDSTTYESKQNLKNEEEMKLNKCEKETFPLEKIDLKVRFENNISSKSADTDSLNDDAHLIDSKLYRIQENPDYYVNEGISRL